MSSHSRKALRVVAIFIAVGALAFLTSAAARGGSRRPPKTRSAELAAAVQPNVSTAVAFGQSIPVRDMPKTSAPSGLPRELEIDKEAPLIHPTGDGSFRGPDPALQPSAPGSGIPPTSQNFEGTDVGESSSDGVFVLAPPD